MQNSVKDKRLSIMVLCIFQEFVKKGVFYHQALEAARYGMQDAQSSFYALCVLKELVKQGQFYAEILLLAQDYVRDGGIPPDVFPLFVEFVKQGQFYMQSLDALKSMESHNRFSLVSSCNMFEAFVEKDQYFQEAFDCAKKTYEVGYTHQRLKALKLFTLLAEKGQFCGEMKSYMEKGLTEFSDDVKHQAMCLKNAIEKQENAD